MSSLEQLRPVASVRPLRQFIALDLAAAIAGLVVSVVVLVAYSADWLLPLVMACGASVLLLAWAYWAAGRTKIDLAVYLAVSTFWLMLVITTTVAPSIFGGFAVLMVWPVLLAVPHVTRATLRSIAVVTATVAGVTMPLALRHNTSPATSNVPGWVFDVVFVTVGVVFVALSINQVWAYSGRLTGALEELSSLNAELAHSERLLEARVATRTEALVDTTRELVAVLDNIADGLVTIDRQGVVTRVNPPAARMFDRTADEMVGRPAATAFPWIAELGPEIDPIHGNSLRAGDVALTDGRVGRAVATPITDAHGSPRGTVVMVSDVTAVRELDRMKTDFISTVSHELRTPLTSVLGFVKLIRRRLEDRIVPAISASDSGAAAAVEHVRNDVAIIVSEGERLARLIDDLLDIAKIEAGRIEWRDEPVMVNDVVGQAVAATRTLFESKRLALDVDLDPRVGVVRGDGHRIVQVLVNLLSNACKFTERGSVSVTTRASGPVVSVSVTDTGAGIHEDDFPHLFQRFKQVGDTLTGKPRGTGLGLPICKEIIDHHGGRLTVSSRLGRGSTFSFTLPVDRRAQAPERAEQTEHPKPPEHRPRSGGSERRLVLVVDDDESHRTLLREELEIAGFDVAEADGGAAALVSARRLRPDVITLDVLMPDIDGFTVAGQLRDDTRTASIPIVAVTVADVAEHAARAGIDSYLEKPVESARLVAELRSVVNRTGSGAEVP